MLNKHNEKEEKQEEKQRLKKSIKHCMILKILIWFKQIRS